MQFHNPAPLSSAAPLPPALRPDTAGIDRLVLRSLSADDIPDIVAHFQQMSEFDRYTRFFSGTSDSGIEAIVNRFDWTRTIAVGLYRGTELCGLAELGWETNEAAGSPDRAEVAFSVDRSLRNRGIGAWLVERICHEALTAGITQIYATWLGGNDAVGKIMRARGAKVWLNGSVWHGEVRLDDGV